MKNRIIFTAENDAPIPEGVKRKQVEKEIQMRWQYLLDVFSLETDGSKVTVEKVEVFD